MQRTQPEPTAAKISHKGGLILTPALAHASATDAANMQMRKACRTRWNEDDFALAVETEARLLRSLGGEWVAIADGMVA